MPAKVFEVALMMAATLASRVRIQANGASFPNRLYQQATFAYKFINPNVDVSYISTGSGSGKCRILNFTERCSSSDSAQTAPLIVDWVGSDSLLSYPSNYDNYPDVQMYPAVAGAVVPIYNLAGHNSSHPELILSPRLLSKIFGASAVEGGITRWNDPSIVALNPQLHALGLLTDAPIVLMVREDESGTTEIFTKALSAFDSSFASSIGATTSSSKWASSVTKADTNGGVAASVLATRNSIGYSILAEAQALQIPMASLVVRGNIVTASAEAVEFALVEKGTLFGNNGQPVWTLTANIHDTVSPKAWPIAGYTYLIMRKDTTHTAHGQSCQTRLETVKYWKWFWTSDVVRNMALRLGFAILPEVVRRVVLSQLLSDIKCNGVPVYTAPVEAIIFGTGSGMLSSILELYKLAYSATDSGASVEYAEASDTAAALDSVLSSTLVIGVPRKDSEGFLIAPSGAVSAETASANVVLPFAGVAIAVFFSRCGASLSGCAIPDVTLTLSVHQLVDILDGTITSWADQRLVQTNPWLEGSAMASAGEAIQLIGEPETSETMVLLRQLLAPYKPGASFAATFGSGGSAITELTRDRVRSRTIDTPWSIGITALVGSTHKLLQVVPVIRSSPASERRMQEGAAVLPSPASILACASDTHMPSFGQFDGRFNLAGSNDPSCYPLAVATVLVVRQSFRPAECTTSGGSAPLPLQLARFIEWLKSDNSQGPISNENMAPLSALMPSFERLKMNSLACDDVALIAPSPSPPPPGIASCSDGQIVEYSAGTLECVACPVGKYEVEHRLCRPAPATGFINRTGATINDVKLCPPHTRHLTFTIDNYQVSIVPTTGGTSEQDCVCDAGYYTPSSLDVLQFVNASAPLGSESALPAAYNQSSLKSALECIPCPKGAVCLGGRMQPYAQIGFSKVGPTHFEACHGHQIGVCDAHAAFSVCDCPGGGVDVEATGFSYLDKVSSSQINHLVVPFRCGDAYVNGTRMCGLCVDDAEGKYALNTQGQCVKCVLSDAFYFFSSVLYVALWFPAIRYLITRKMRSMYTTLQFFQFVGFYVYSFNIPWSEELVQFASVFHSFNLNLNFTQLSCVIGSWENQWLVQLLLPVILPVLVCLRIAVSKLCNCLMTDQQQTKLGIKPFRDFSRKALAKRFGVPILFYLNMYMYTGAATSLRMLVCAEVNGEYYLKAHPPLTCWEGAHMYYAAWAILGVVFYIAGYLAFFLYVLYFEVPKMSQTVAGARRAASLYGFLYLRFSSECWTYEIYEVVRKLSFAFIATVGSLSSPQVMSFSALAIMWFMVYLETSMHPFAVPLYDLYGELSTAVEAVVITVGLVVVTRAENDSPVEEGMLWLEGVAWAAIIAMICLACVVSISDLWINYRLKRIKKFAQTKRMHLSPRLFAIAMNSYLLPDSLEHANSAELDAIRECDELLMRAVIDGKGERSFKDLNQNTRYERQSETTPYLLDTLLGMWTEDQRKGGGDDASLEPISGAKPDPKSVPQVTHLSKKVSWKQLLQNPLTSVIGHLTYNSQNEERRSRTSSQRKRSLTSAIITMDELTQSFHNRDDVRGRMPSVYFFQQTAVGPVISWLSQHATAEEKQVVKHACTVLHKLKLQRKAKSWVLTLDLLGMSKLVLRREKCMRKAMRASSRGDNAAIQSGVVLAAQNMEALAYESVSAPSKHTFSKISTMCDVRRSRSRTSTSSKVTPSSKYSVEDWAWQRPCRQSSTTGCDQCVGFNNCDIPVTEPDSKSADLLQVHEGAGLQLQANANITNFSGIQLAE